MQQIGSWAILNCMNTTFAELGLNEQILSGVAELGFEAPTPVQAQTIPQILKGLVQERQLLLRCPLCS